MMTDEALPRTPEEREAIWILAYLRAQSEVDDTDGGFPQCAFDVAMGLVNLGSRVRWLTREPETPFLMAMRRLTFATDAMLAMLLVPGEQVHDEQIAQAWRGALAEARALL